MDVEIPVLTGYLNVPTQSSFSLNRISKKKPCHRYCLLFNSSRHGIERLEICESKDDKNPKIITLENCVKITQEPPPANLIQIVKKTETLTLNTLTDEDLKEWINALQMVAFRDKTSTHSHPSAIEEDNDLYCSSFGDGLFNITLIPSDTSIKCNIEPKSYMLHLTATDLQLKSNDDLSIIIATWPYRFIRKYGYRDGKFTFEAGRKCYTGEGLFKLDHNNPQEIFRCMAAKMRTMKKLIHSQSAADCNENQLSAVASSMEAGSRSPLPPSGKHTLDMSDTSSPLCASLRGFLSSNDSLNNCSFGSTSNNSSCTNIMTPLPPYMPNKPARKLDRPPASAPATVNVNPLSYELKSSASANCDKLKKYQNYDRVSITSCMDPKNAGSSVMIKPNSPDITRQLSVPSVKTTTTTINNNNNNSSSSNIERDYESIETITDAWKTRGVGEIKHTERTNEEDDFPRQRTLSQRDKKITLASNKIHKIIDIDIGEGGGSNNSTDSTDDTYDRLDYLSPNNKTSSGYKTIVPVISPPTRLRCSSPSLNDYELIGTPDMQPCRKADDSHLGYGVLRKTSAPALTTAQNSNANTTNNAMQAGTSNNNNINSSNSNSSEAVITLSGRLVDDRENDANALVDHRNYNGLNYTIVSKPKRV